MSKVLVVDDDEFSLKFLEKILAPAGYGVSKAKNGVQALEMLARDRYDLIITDISMPRIGGIRLLETAKKKYRIPAIVVTASDIDSDAQRRSYAAGASKFMVKPLDAGEVLDTVKDVLERDTA